MVRRTALNSILFCMGLASCGRPRPPELSSVAIPATRITATAHGLPARVDELSGLARQAFDASHAERRAPASEICARPELTGAPPRSSGPARYLVLSGGSLNGAFGAGFFLGLQDKEQLPPEADVVTGVSTGSLQATFLFLARRNLANGKGGASNDRDYKWVGGAAARELPGLDGRAAPKPGESDIGDLALAYSTEGEPDIYSVYPLGGVGLLINGAKGSLEPLRRRLMALISPGTIQAVAAQACRGRKLYVGVADVDDGYGYALDLTALALSAFEENATDTRMALVRKAYVAALLASSSVPVGAKPVRLRVRLVDGSLAHQRRNLFVDGGARFGVFLQTIKAARDADAAGSDVTLIVNTRLSIEPWHSGDLDDPKAPWLITTLGLRTVDILENQVYQLSVGSVEGQAGHLAMAYISNENIAERGQAGELPEAHIYRGQNCEAWHEADQHRSHPVQFYPGYMACLLDYGRRRGELSQWNRLSLNTSHR